MNGKIIECSWNPEENQWEFMRIRKDKETPNARHVYEKVISVGMLLCFKVVKVE